MYVLYFMVMSLQCRRDLLVWSFQSNTGFTLYLGRGPCSNPTLAFKF